MKFGTTQSEADFCLKHWGPIENGEEYYKNTRPVLSVVTHFYERNYWLWELNFSHQLTRKLKG